MILRPILSQHPSRPVVGDLVSGEGAASGALGEASSEESPKFDALSLLDPVKQEDQEEVTAEQIFEELADLAEPSSGIVEAPLEDAESNTHLETGNPEEFDNQTPQESAEVSNTADLEPKTGHSPAAPSRPPRIRGTKGGRKEQTKRLIKRWQQDFDILARFVWDEAEFWLHYVQHEDAHPELIWTVRVIRVLINHCTTNQILVHLANVFAPLEIGRFTTVTVEKTD